jgi:hypothetical protein
VGIDCQETAFSMSFGQDECYNDPDFDAGLRQPPGFTACTRDSFTFDAFNCDAQEAVFAYLNVLLDMNEDGDWNDNFLCPAGCAPEWAVKNVLVQLPPGCSRVTTPGFLVGPNGGEAWLRITLSLDPVGDDFPWNGSAGAGFLVSGETEDYPVTIAGPDTCQVGYIDYGDAPEGFAAYLNGNVGQFPTCLAPNGPGSQEIECESAISTAPGQTGYVRHVASPADPMHFWLGCGNGASPLLAVDTEAEGKTHNHGIFQGPSFCDQSVNTDCTESLIGQSMNQDECVGDIDAGMRMPTFFRACSTATFEYEAYNCGTQDVEVYLNVLVDFNHDGDWNDNLLAACGTDTCANEWAVKNFRVTLASGCGTYMTPQFSTGPDEGRSWLRITLTTDPVLDDFPWNGSVGEPNGYYTGGETEDHPVNIVPRTTDVGFGDGGGGLMFAAPRPNPARDRVAFSYALPERGEVSLAIFDLNGRLVVEIEDGARAAGPHHATWDFRDSAGRPVPAGLYLAKLRAGSETVTRSVIRLR